MTFRPDRPARRIPLLCALSLVACSDSGSPGGGERSDTFLACPTDVELIAQARADFIALDPEQRDLQTFDDAGALVERPGDLNADGAPDVVIKPGVDAFGGPPNVVMMAYLTSLEREPLTETSSCPTRLVGLFHGVGLELLEDEVDEVCGVHAARTAILSPTGCEGEVTTWRFDCAAGEYVAGETELEQICAEEEEEEE
jgi:hypothetical protein